MRLFAAIAVLVAALPSLAAPAISLKVHESRTIQLLGTTAAWAIDANVVDAAAVNGSVLLFGRAPGKTKVMVVSMTGESALDVTVEGQPHVAVKSNARPPEQTTAEVRYSSATREVQNNVAMTRETKSGRDEAQVRTLHQTRPNGDRAATSIASASYRIFTKNREITLLDRDVQHSPLTLSATPVRGIHYLDEHWRIHAGVTAYATYQSFLIPVEREAVVGAAYAIRTSARSIVTPGVFVYRGQGSVLSLLYDYTRSERASLRAELGYSNGVGGALQLRYDTQRDHAAADLRYRPRDFAVLGAGSMRGLQADANWSHTYGRGSNVAIAFTSADLPSLRERITAANLDVDHRLTDRVTLTGGTAYGAFNRARSITIPIGARVDFTRGGIGAIVRYAESSTDRGGHGARLFARASLGRFYASAYADHQQNAPTLDVIFSEQPELALALSELGIAATSPADIARALREQAALAELGFIEGVTVDLAPTRTQAGVELAWLSTSAARHQLRARLLHSVVESVASRSETTLATLTYARRITSATDVFAGYTWWRSERRGQEEIEQPYLEVGVRQRFDGAPSFGSGSGAITGIVFADEDLDGVSDGTGVAAEVELDGAQKQQTAPDGTFAFKGVARGDHRLTARVANGEAYFTTPSRVEVAAGDRVAFGVATTPARLFGRVLTDAGKGIGGVRVLLARGAKQVIATTGSDGTFATATAPGEWEVSILTDSVPAGHSLVGTEARTVALDRTQPRNVEWQLRALRSISGRGAPANVEIELAPIGKRVRTDAEGRFSVRSLPPGEVTIVAGSARRRVVVPNGPASLVVDFGELAKAEEIRTVVTGERRDVLRGWVVQLGAYRIHRNAIETQARAKKSGVDAELATSGALTLVRTRPFASKAEADAAAAALQRNGIEAVVVSTK